MDNSRSSASYTSRSRDSLLVDVIISHVVMTARTDIDQVKQKQQKVSASTSEFSAVGSQ